MNTSFWKSCLVVNTDDTYTYQPDRPIPRSSPSSSATEDVTGSVIYSSTRHQMDKFLADSMLQLSVQERENALNDLHGIGNGRDEVPEDAATMNGLLEKLDKILNATKQGTLYEQAERNDPMYVTSRDFRMMFLRTCDYDPEASVHRIFKFLALQQSLFSAGKVGKKILLEDLDGEAIESLKSGAMQISASTDRAGRKILFLYPQAYKVMNTQSDTRARYYILMALMESEEVQRKGFVGVYFSSANSKNDNGKLLDLPLRLAGFHACVSDWRIYFIGSVAIHSFPSSAVPKFRIHCGSDMECLYQLGSFGIPLDALPLSTDTFQLDNGYHIEWYRQRLQMERNQFSSSSSVVLDSPTSFHRMTIMPGPNDVLLGHARNNGGNRVLRSIVASLLEEYNSSPKKLKTAIANKVVKEIAILGGRFLKPISDGTRGWEEISHFEAVQKASKTFRNCRRKYK
eukprot:scaffold4954_cov106-Cylindrotheca_fusiformis.AAC.4